jgi:hypothetical protein
MARLATSLAATALATLRWLEPWTVAGGRLGGIAGVAANLFAQACQLGGQGSELGAQLLNLLLLGQNKTSDGGRSRQPIRL